MGPNSDPVWAYATERGHQDPVNPDLSQAQALVDRFRNPMNYRQNGCVMLGGVAVGSLMVDWIEASDLPSRSYVSRKNRVAKLN